MRAGNRLVINPGSWVGAGSSVMGGTVTAVVSIFSVAGLHKIEKYINVIRNWKKNAEKWRLSICKLILHNILTECLTLYKI